MTFKVTMEFENEEQAEVFFNWLCNSGEQEYWQEKEYQPESAEYIVSFDYFAGSDEFLGNQKVICKAPEE